MVKILWDKRKREANIAKHGLDFATSDEDFFWTARIAKTKHGRFQALGQHEGSVIVLIFSRLGVEAFSAISMRPANTREKREL